MTAPQSSNGKVICPHCWHRFEVHEVLAVAEGADLIGDPVLGEDEAARFLPSRFNPEGFPVDAQGLTCTDLACPRCHLRVPRSLMQKAPLFFSIIGAPASGKSFLLATMVWRLGQRIPPHFALAI